MFNLGDLDERIFLCWTCETSCEAVVNLTDIGSGRRDGCNMGMWEFFFALGGVAGLI